jgi:hypothetical protein
MLPLLTIEHTDKHGTWVVWSYGFERENAEEIVTLVNKVFEMIVCKIGVDVH